MTRLPWMPRPHKHHRPHRPVVLAVALVVVGRASHFALNDDHQLLADLQLFGPANHIGHAGQEFRNQLHLVGVVIDVTIELCDR